MNDNRRTRRFGKINRNHRLLYFFTLGVLAASWHSQAIAVEITASSDPVNFLGDYKIPAGHLQLNQPSGIAADTNGDLYVTDTLNHRIVVFDAGGTAVRTFGHLGAGPAALDTPMAVAVDSKRKRIYIADSSNHRIQSFASDGTFLSVTSLEQGRLPEEKKVRPLGIAIDSQGNLFVTDADNHQVRKYSSDGKFLLKFGGAGEKDGLLYVPVGVFIDSQDRVYVVDMNNSRIQVFDVKGKFLFKFGELGNSPGNFFRPKWVTVDSNGFIYVSDAGHLVVEVFDRSGKYQYLIGEEKDISSQFSSPFGLAVNHGFLYVSDRWKNSIRVFKITEKGK